MMETGNPKIEVTVETTPTETESSETPEPTALETVVVSAAVSAAVSAEEATTAAEEAATTAEEFQIMVDDMNAETIRRLEALEMWRDGFIADWVNTLPAPPLPDGFGLLETTTEETPDETTVEVVEVEEDTVKPSEETSPAKKTPWWHKIL